MPCHHFNLNLNCLAWNQQRIFYDIIYISFSNYSFLAVKVTGGNYDNSIWIGLIIESKSVFSSFSTKLGRFLLRNISISVMVPFTVVLQVWWFCKFFITNRTWHFETITLKLDSMTLPYQKNFQRLFEADRSSNPCLCVRMWLIQIGFRWNDWLHILQENGLSSVCRLIWVLIWLKLNDLYLQME